jgi:hypothetical protein
MKEEIAQVNKIVQDMPIIDSLLTPFQKKLLIGFLVLAVSVLSFTATVLNFVRGTKEAIDLIIQTTTIVPPHH